ncbi:hypothetical protein SPBR_05581 [Sporothrix brasiliensis 5110]|uniref:Homeobox domain-containing protein n=1 Tax=Sporothrix brasiliensis 5110 TaxID=1398154 RepID=A0A0C2FT27_9PEZI|nr:uncharacterized protein SPBR_05581 [Sporothrix brasiliensis 5110]KIH94138.1 hypothetical protein SPBR_05581 [Sporothrix brasiliensis 5110]
MLATRRSDTELSHPWSFSKLETSSSALSLKHSPPSPGTRMSNTGFETPLSNAATEWSGQYSFLPPAEPIFAAQAYDHVNGGAGSGNGSAGSGGVVDSSTTSSGTSTTNNGVANTGGQTQTRPSTGTNGDGSGGGSIKDDSSLNAGASPLGLHHRRSIDPLGLRQHSVSGTAQTTVASHNLSGKTPPTPTTATSEQHQHHQNHYGQHTHGSDVVSMAANPLSSVLQQQQPDIHSAGSGGEDHSGLKDDDDDLIDDEDMGEAGEGDGAPAPAQTAAERTAQRRKMKRFRLTHQQTRFLMSEFAKQPHPDAAHRERLSRQIPGLSPRQVQVWFQNRRAKIKRLAADDRERMIKMRAVPDDFDNVQALHSPYGAVHGLGTPMASPVDYGAAAAAAAAAASSYSDHMMRPLMVDVRRTDGTNTSGGDDQSQHSQHQQHSHLQHSHHSHHLSPTGLSPGFGNIGFGTAATGGMGSSDILSPLSPASNTDHRYSSYSSLSSGVTGTTTAGSGSNMSPRTAIPYTRQNSGNGSLDGSQNQNQQSQSQQSANQRHHIRPLQPLQLRETVSRSRSDNLQSPLRSSMSWKGDSLDYSNYHHGSATGGAGSTSPGRSSLYPSDGLGNGSSSAGLSGYDSYSGSTVHSPTHMAYPGYQTSPGIQAAANNNQSRSSRLRAASATLPLALDLRTTGVGTGSMGGGSPYRSISTAAGALSPTAGTPRQQQQMGSLNGLVSSSGYGTNYATSYASNNFATTAPLTAPLDFSMSSSVSRTGAGSGIGYRTGSTSSMSNGGVTDYTSMPQMSAPLAPPNDFSQAFLGTGAGTSGAVSASVSATSIAALSNNTSGGRASSYGTGLGHHTSTSIGSGLDRSSTGGTTASTVATAITVGSGTTTTDFSTSPTDTAAGLGGLKRKHSFTTGANTNTNVYGSTA